MSFELKTSFLQELKQALADRITASALSETLSAAADVLEHYEFSRAIRTDEACSMDLFETWTASLRVEGRSEKTIAYYSYVINRMLSDLGVPIRSITAHHIRAWLSKEKARGISDNTLNNNRSVCSSMFGWLWSEGLIDRNPVANIGTIKVPKRIREAYSDVDIENLKAACTKKRNLAIITFLLSTGCRISEVTNLNRNQIDFVSKEVTVLGKGNKERVVYFDDITSMHLRRYLDTRTDDNPALFVGQRRNRLTQNGVRQMLKTLAKKAGVENVHPHRFRRTLATMLIAHGMPIQEVSSILGHERLDTTMKYVVLDKAAIKNSYRKYA